ncbi:helix-turn-helix domain-containing protein [Shewanella sp. A25]|nr:helix-turn-helix domain-containing protein [Shewanella shenzhenensis]
MPNNPNQHVELYIDKHRLIKKPMIQTMLGVSRSTLERWIKSGKFPPATLKQQGQSRWLFAEVERWRLANYQ